MRNHLRLLFVGLFLSLSLGAQSTTSSKNETPKLVVGLVVDQMRWDYLNRYQDQYGNDGFNRMIREGYSFSNVMIDYIPTVTALGHTSVYTGSVPSIHGIAGNDWLDRETGENIYCTTDKQVKGVGSSSDKIGGHSPQNLNSTTITDQLGMATNFRSKVVGVSLKDRASILPAGHNPLGAFWFDEGNGHFVTSSYYMNELPKWLQDFNAKNHARTLVSKGWNLVLNPNEYKESTRDDVSWEGLLGSAKSPTFPYKNLLADFDKDKNVIRTTPFGNTLTLMAATAAVDGYGLGKGSDTDFLVVNLASTDYVGHKFGPNSIEVQDTYIRLDRDLAEFFKALDQKVGKGKYLVFLTADHGAAHSEGYLKENKMKSGFFDRELIADLKEELKDEFGKSDLILGFQNYQVYLNRKAIKSADLDYDKVASHVVEWLNTEKSVLYAVELRKLAQAAIPEPIKTRMTNGYHWQRSGDIQIITQDGLLPSYSKTGTTHSVWNSYDSHIPLLFMGTGVKKGASSKPYHMTDIAPTVAQMLKIENPSGTIGNPISELVD